MESALEEGNLEAVLVVEAGELGVVGVFVLE